MDQNWLQFGIETMAPLIELLAVLVVAVVGELIRKQIKKRTDNEAAALFLGRLNDAALDAVLTTEQTFVRRLKANAADGKLSRADARDAGKMALTVLRGYLGPKGIATARDVLGHDEQALDMQLRRLIEAKIAERKQ